MKPFTGEDLSEMVIRLTHGIRNPLATIKAEVQLAKHLGKPDEEVAAMLDSAIAEVDRINLIVTNMQRYVRLEASTAVTVKIGDAAEATIVACAERARAAGIRLERAEEPQCTVLVDPDQLDFALKELVENGICFSRTGGTVRLWWEVHGKWEIEVHVDDEGPGIPAVNNDRITRPFFSTSTQGNGLGLAIVEKFCDISGGQLTWQNRPEGGCRFTAALPSLDLTIQAGQNSKKSKSRE